MEETSSIYSQNLVRKIVKVDSSFFVGDCYVTTPYHVVF